MPHKGGTDSTRRQYIKATGTAGVVGVTALAGCPGDTGGGEALTIGATIPETGQFSSLGTDLDQGYSLGVDLLNEELDRDVELITQDDESDPQVVGQRLQQIASNNDLDMIWGSFASPLVTAGSAFAENNDLPFLGAFFAHEEPHRTEGYEWTFAPFPKSRDVARSTLGLLESIPEGERPSTVGIWEPNTGWGQEQADRWEETLGDAGFDVALRETFSLGTDDFGTLITQSADRDVQVVLSNPTPPGAITAVNQMRDNNYTPEVLKFVRGADPFAFWSALEGDGAYALMCPGWVPGMTGGGNDAFRSAYEEEYGLDEGELIPVAVGGSYNIAQVALQAIDAAGSTEAADVQSALQSETFTTVIGEFSFEENGLPTEGELTAPTGQWWEGGQHVVYPDTDGEEAIDFQFPIEPWGER